MEAYTRCPACEATYQMDVHELAEAAGVVRCSNCGKSFNSLASLFKHRPEEQDQPLRGGGMPPLLSNRIFLQHEIPGLDEADPELETLESALDATASGAAIQAEADESAASSVKRSTGWAAIALSLLFALVAQAVWLFELPDRLRDQRLDKTLPPQDAIALVARDLHAHPTMSDAVIISATLRNRMSVPLELPLIELRLYDSTNQVLGARRFQPMEYLPKNRSRNAELRPDDELPIILEVMVTGSQPAGFEFRYFHST